MGDKSKTKSVLKASWPTKEWILDQAKQGVPLNATALAAKRKISRQNMSAHLGQLVLQGKLIKQGSTKNSTYVLPHRHKVVPDIEVKLSKLTSGLQEDRVFNEINLRLGLQSKLDSNVFQIIQYGFTEMLNNAIDHSQSKTVQIRFTLSPALLAFQINDHGIGVFENIKKGFNLADDFEAVEHLFKGKQSTDPARHSGQGIFFTSRVADRFWLRSRKLTVTRDNAVDDLFVKQERLYHGTQVGFEIKRKTRANLKNLFESFSNDDFEFDKNDVSITLTQATGLVSRSQAKRLLVGLEKYSRINFNFKNVSEVGQGFVDEIFRVFKNQHPSISLTHSNANPFVTLMISRCDRA